MRYSIRSLVSTTLLRYTVEARRISRQSKLLKHLCSHSMPPNASSLFMLLIGIRDAHLFAWRRALRHASKSTVGCSACRPSTFPPRPFRQRIGWYCSTSYCESAATFAPYRKCLTNRLTCDTKSASSSQPLSSPWLGRLYGYHLTFTGQHQFLLVTSYA